MTENLTEQTVTDEWWACSMCGYTKNPLAEANCGDCRNARAGLLRPEPEAEADHVAPPSGGLHGWRITLPDFSVLPLPPGQHIVGRGHTLSDRARVLRQFADVSRVQLELDVTAQTLEVNVPGPSTVVFLVEGDEYRPITTQTMGPGDAWTLCLGQNCFVRIDRGVA